MQTQTLDTATVGTLAAARSEPSVSIVLPSAERGSEVDQGPIRLKNAIAEVEHDLESAGVRGSVTTRVLEPFRALQVDPVFWSTQGKGLALFASEDQHEIIRLPYSVPNSVTVSDRFHVRPLVPAMSNKRVAVLAVSRGARRLFIASRHAIDEMPIDAPASMADANWFVDREAQLQRRPARSAGFHGHGDTGRTDQADLARYLKAVAQAVGAVTDSPVALATTDEIRGAYLGVATHEVLDARIGGSHDQTRPDELHRAIVDVVDAGPTGVEQRRSTARSQGHELDELGSILAAAAQGRVGELIVDIEADRQWGDFDPSEMEARITTSPGNGHIDLIDLSIETTMRHGGVVSAAPMDVPVVALLRY